MGAPTAWRITEVSRSLSWRGSPKHSQAAERLNASHSGRMARQYDSSMWLTSQPVSILLKSTKGLLNPWAEATRSSVIPPERWPKNTAWSMAYGCGRRDGRFTSAKTAGFSMLTERSKSKAPLKTSLRNCKSWGSSEMSILNLGMIGPQAPHDATRMFFDRQSAI